MVQFLRRHRVLLLLILVAAAYYPRFLRRPDGVTLYPLGAEALMHGISLERGAPGFTYPPIVALVMIPMVPLPMWLRNLTWYVVLIACTWFSFRLCVQLVHRDFPELAEGKKAVWWKAMALLLSLKFILADFENQAYDPIVLLCLLVGLRGMQRQKDLQAASGLAMAAALKVTPLLFFPYLLWRRHIKLFFMCLALYAAISFLPDALFVQKGASTGYFATWVQDVAAGAVPKASPELQPRQWEHPNPLNQSLRGLVYRMSNGPDGAASRRVVLAATYISFSLVIFVLIVLSTRIPRAQLFDSSLLLISMLMLSPMSSKSHFVILMLPYLAASACVIIEPSLRRVGVGVLSVSFILCSLTSKDLVGKRLSDACASAGCVTIGTLVLVVFFGYAIFQHRKEKAVGI